MKRLLLPLILGALLLERLPAETILGTAISKIPFTITKPGAYHFIKDLSFTSPTNDAIKVEATNVIIDLNGHCLTAIQPSNSANGIECTGENRVTVKDGTIRGFQIGALFISSDYARLEDLLITNCGEAGISIDGCNHSDVTHNRVADTGAVPTNVYSLGINVSGTYGSITNNQIENTSQTDSANHFATGIRLTGCSDIVVNDNHVLNVEPSVPIHSGSSTGILLDRGSPSSNIVVLDNVSVSAQTGFDLSGGSSGNYGDNVTNGVTNGYLDLTGSMTNIGNNN